MNDQHAKRVFIQPPALDDDDALMAWCQSVIATIARQVNEQPPNTDEPPIQEAATSQDIPDEDWTGLIAAMGETLMSIHLGQFIVVGYETETDSQPYAQAAASTTGYDCEIVSEHLLPGHAWPVNDDALGRHGWAPPEDEGSNWVYPAPDAALAARAMVDGLRFGRACVEPFKYNWHIGEFPPRGGGEGVEAQAAAA